MSAPKGKKNLKPGQRVVLKSLPNGFIDDLPLEERQAISEVVGRPILLKGYEEEGRAVLEFTDRNYVIHILYVDPNFIETFVH